MKSGLTGPCIPEGREDRRRHCNSTERIWQRGSPPGSFGILTLLVCLATIVAGPAMAGEFDPTHHLYDSVVRGFVENGWVDYAGLKAGPNTLSRYLDSVARVTAKQFNTWSEAQQLAFLCNLYNAATLQLILDHYPVKTIKDIGGLFRGPWDQPVVRLFGDTITLNTLEHKILRKKYSEPRIHMALVCAAKGCPPLRSEAYVAEKLDTQLDDQAKIFLGNPIKFRIDRDRRMVYLSPIFKWYGEDFIGKYTPKAGFEGLSKAERALLSFCSRYLSAADQKYLAAGGYLVRYLDYDWSLNERQVPK